MHPIGEMAVLIEVVEQGSFSAAARRLGLASSVVADRVKGLERRLGVRLLARTTRRQSLTEAGATYLREARAILATVTIARSGSTPNRPPARSRAPTTPCGSTSSARTPTFPPRRRLH